VIRLKGQRGPGSGVEEARGGSTPERRRLLAMRPAHKCSLFSSTKRPRTAHDPSSGSARARLHFIAFILTCRERHGSSQRMPWHQCHVP